MVKMFLYYKKLIVIYLEEAQLMGDSLSIILLSENNIFFIIYIDFTIAKIANVHDILKGFKA